MPKFPLIGALIVCVCLAISPPVSAKPPGGTPPGQAKKDKGGVNFSVGVGGSTQSVVSDKPGGGPPPWAPAHGHRANTGIGPVNGYTLIVDAGCIFGFPTANGRPVSNCPAESPWETAS